VIISSGSRIFIVAHTHKYTRLYLILTLIYN
jgi:hypothetical protein